MMHLFLEADNWREELAAAFSAVAGRRVRMVLRCGEDAREYVGRVPAVRRWRAEDDSCLVLAPGSTDGVHVLAEMELRVRFTGGQFYLARRRWYEDEDLDVTRLGPGPLELAFHDL